MWLLLVGMGLAGETETTNEGGAEEQPPLLQVGIGAGIGGGMPSTRFRLEIVSARPIPVGSLRFIVADRLILEPSFRYFQTLERGVESDRDELEDELTFSETEWGLAIKPVLLRRDASQIYPYLAYGREEVSITGQDYVEGEEELRSYSDVDIVHAAHLGFGIQRWLDESWTVSVDASVVNVGWYHHTQSVERSEFSEESSGTYWAFYPTAQLMLHLYL